jgi:uncharacterized protein (UPF0276 family)
MDNYDLNTGAFLEELDLSYVHEIHVANGPVKDGFKMDVHQYPTSERTRKFTREVLDIPACNPQALTYEILPELLPALGREGLAAELALLKKTLTGHEA